jgi:hypothetical protein
MTIGLRVGHLWIEFLVGIAEWRGVLSRCHALPDSLQLTTLFIEEFESSYTSVYIVMKYAGPNISSACVAGTRGR